MTEDQQRVANMENDAIRFESAPAAGVKGPIDFILKDLQLNEYLRESAQLAQLVQQRVADIHPGGDHGVQQAAFMVLTTARRPAILVETGFATNPTDGAFLASSLGEHKIASAVAEAQSYWAQAAVKAESVVARHPTSRWADAALVLEGEALARSGACAQAAAPLARAVDSVRDAALRERARLATAQCALEANDPVGASRAVAGVTES